jgi:hypothetical protein
VSGGAVKPGLAPEEAVVSYGVLIGDYCYNVFVLSWHLECETCGQVYTGLWFDQLHDTHFPFIGTHVNKTR